MATALPWASNTREANQQFGIAAQVVGKFLEGGKLAEGDIARYRKLLPDINDTREVAQRKLDNVKDLMFNNYNGLLDTQARAGFDVSGFEYMPSRDETFTQSLWREGTQPIYSNNDDAYIASLQTQDFSFLPN